MVEIIWSPLAQKDLNDIIDYIAQDSPHYALVFYDQIQENIVKLQSFPKIGREVPELHNSNIRELLVGKYRLIYYILEDNLEIVRIIHSARLLEL